jgi:uncharacterized SAM-dependent methyltransferase
MLYFKNVELSKKYGVSLGAVRNWIEAAQAGKLDLLLQAHGNKTYVANIPSNVLALEQLVEKGKKFRNTRSAKLISPKPEFYEIFNENQVYDIATNLEVHHEIPRQYNYFNGGAHHWDEYAERLATEKTPNVINSTINLLQKNRGYIDDLLRDHKRVNVIDIGVGNAYPVKELLSHLLEQGKLGRYIALDISPTMLEIAEKNIQNWFGNSIAFEGHECDINYDRFSSHLIQEYAQENAKDTVNLVLLLGGTLSNMRDGDNAYRIIRDSMGVNDYLIHSYKLDTEATRNYFDFSVKPGEMQLATIHGLVVDLLNIDRSFYKIELGYDPKLNQRFERISLNVSLTIQFNFESGVRNVELNKGDSILTWRAWHKTVLGISEQFDRTGFHLLHSSQTADETFILTVSRVKKGQ